MLSQIDRGGDHVLADAFQVLAGTIFDGTILFKAFIDIKLNDPVVKQIAGEEGELLRRIPALAEKCRECPRGPQRGGDFDQLRCVQEMVGNRRFL